MFYEADDSFDMLGDDNLSEVLLKKETQTPNQVSNYSYNNNNNNINSTSVKPLSPYYDEIYDKMDKRNRLPKKRIDLNLNVWSILKDAVGKDLNKFCVPGKI